MQEATAIASYAEKKWPLTNVQCCKAITALHNTLDRPKKQGANSTQSNVARGRVGGKHELCNALKSNAGRQTGASSPRHRHSIKSLGVHAHEWRSLPGTTNRKN